MLILFLSVYIGWLLGLVLTTAFLIICGYGWGPLPHFYIRLVKFMQSFYPHNYPSTETWPAIIKRCHVSSLRKHHNDSLSSFLFSEVPMLSTFDICSDAFKAGFEAIIQDQMSVAFEAAPSYYSTLLERPDRLPFPNTQRNISRQHIFGYFIALLFRYGILLPVRLCLILISFVFSTSAIVADHFIEMTEKQKLRIGITYCRLFCAGIGLVAKYHNRQYRPKQPGIAVANHLSPNDVQIIYADIDPNNGYGFTVTGQRHGGFIWFVESIADKFVPTLWLERRSTIDRKRFMDEVLQEAKFNGPVLLFPEGYCTNNTRILQFRRAVFEDSIIIYPIAIRQNARFGDSFWSEKTFWQYLLRILTSWAIVYDVTYLKPYQKQSNESNQDFAQRVQNAIAETWSLMVHESEQQRMKSLQMENIAKLLRDLITERRSREKSDAMKSSKSLNGIKSPVLSTIVEFH
ncbi:Glycerol-3-phosphate acyltransferase 3 [Dirofilaria immitis]|nr:Glycerol-3-phosphate acyltransferase 3 [Dirofilaria immitis]